MTELIRAGANMNATTVDGWTPLMSASLQGHLEIVSLLLELRVEVNQAARDSRTALISAASTGHGRVVLHLLVARADIHLAKRTGASPLHVAAWAGHAVVARLLCANGAQKTAIMRDGRTTPIDLARVAGNALVAEVLQ
eukprot:CAMPEP_0176270844 /NCGR_PEP_ID=MMETSP0121_2-20121125/44905_1 /TAXON_ID=160619 /ORGANISM="Kryptoperidinium foliaceum, Strain CCMP 1326" /LENGTH=138 /DNA_ID=CAMNT_0017610993 /DNA_START=105 /DNA_END=521 /DNA_ORIENTATION=+